VGLAEETHCEGRVMKTCYDVPGFLAGYRFQNDPRYYDADNNRFLDLSGYGLHCEKTAGTVAFSTHGANSREGILLNNSNQWRIENPNPWELTFLAIMKGHVESGSFVMRPMLLGDATTASSNGQFLVNANAGATALTSNAATPAAAQNTTLLNHTEEAIFTTCHGFDQESRKAYSTADAVTVNESAAATATVNGNASAPGWNGNIGLAGSENSRYIRIGNNSGTIGDTAANATNYLYLFALFFFKGNTLRTNLPKFKAFLDTEKLYYGIP
jgi:hypothetical protein